MKQSFRLVIADDLTGASDSGVHFLSEDSKVVVIVDPKMADIDIENIDASTLVVNTNTRAMGSQAAFLEVQRIVEKFTALRPCEIYKKIDSTLRGNVGAEIDAMMSASNVRLACVAPATPRNGRTVLEGVCYVNGIPLAATEVAHDPFTPVIGSDVRVIIASQTARKIGVLNLEMVRSTWEKSIVCLKALIKDGNEIIVADAESVTDLAKIRNLFASLDERVLYVGAAGLFHALGFSGENLLAAKSLPIRAKKKNILLVIGSMMKTTVEQISWLQSRTRIGCFHCLVTKDAISSPASETARLIRLLDRCYQSSNVVLLHTDRDNSFLEGHKYVGTVLSAIVDQVVRNNGIDVLVVTGGDTAMHVLKGLSVNHLELIEESLPGIPVGVITIPNYDHKIVFISKAGSFGEPDALERVLEYVEAN